MQDYYVGWLGLAVINAALANASGRSPLKYFLGSLLVCPIVTLLLASTYEDAAGLHLVDLWKGRTRA